MSSAKHHPAGRRRFLSATLFSLPLAGVLGGCATQTRDLRSSQPADLPARVELADTPFFPDESFYCGPAALATVLSAAGFMTDPERVAGQVFVPGREGSLQIEMLVAARRGGAVATVLPGTLEDLLREIAAGHPVVVLSNLGLKWAPSWHYAVAVGYDLDAGEMLLRSGPMKRQQMALRTFEHTWARGGHWAFVALPPGRLPATALEADAVRALVAFERNAPPEQAVLAYRAGLQRWPGNLVLAIGLGNAAYAAGDLPAAEQAFRSAAGRHASAAAWNNLAVVLDEQGRRSEAITAARRAVELSAAGDDGPRETLRRLGGS